MKLKISEKLSLPAEAVTQTFGILAKRGSGKTYLSAVLMEEMVAAGIPVVAIDPVGVLWGLRAAANGKGPGLPVVIFGGDHGDVPLEPSAGVIVADFLMEARRPAVLDLSLMRKGEQARFVADFAERLYHKNREPMHLVLDEADLFAPQNASSRGGLEPRMLGAMEDLVRRGRARGLGVTLITQRPAVLHKDVLTQVEVLVCLRLIAPQDRAAVDAWVKVHGTPEQREELMASLPSLPIGTAWFWSPGWLDIFQKVQIRRRRTFDSSATPTMGVRVEPPAALAPVDIEQLKSRIAATIEKAKAEDPKLLRQRIAELERELAKKAPPAPVRINVPIFDSVAFGKVEAAAAALDNLLEREASAVLTRLRDDLRTYRALCDEPAKRTRFKESESREPKATPPRAAPRLVLAPAARNGAPSASKDGHLAKGAIAILTAAAQHTDGVTREQLSVLTGYKRRSRDTYLQILTAGHLLERTGNRLTATQEGIKKLGSSFEPLPTGSELRRHWLNTLPQGERRVFEVVVDAFPSAVSRELIDQQTGYARRSRDTYLQKLSARELVKSAGSGQVLASKNLF